MKTAAKPQSFRQIQWLKLALVVGLLLVLALMPSGRVEAFSSQKPAQNSAVQTADILEGIILTSGVSDTDTAFLVENLEFLRDHLPAWWLYIQAAKPFALAIDLNAGAQGRAAFTRCCDQVPATIVFGYHFDQITVVGQSLAARRIGFLAILVHEATHVQNQRAGQFTARGDYKTCVEAERSGLSTQLRFEREVLGIPPSDDTIGVGESYTELENSISIETKSFGSRGIWLDYCGDLLD